jgi:hypothetical protein
MKHRVLEIAGLVIAGIAAIAHISVGTYDTLLSLLQSDLAPVLKGTIHACWHFVSIFLVFSVWSFFMEKPYASRLAMLWIGLSVCFILVALITSGISGLLRFPQWMFLGGAGFLLVRNPPKTKTYLR